MTKISYSGYRFLPEIIHQAIWLYLRFTLSFRDVGDAPQYGRQATLWGAPSSEIFGASAGPSIGLLREARPSFFCSLATPSGRSEADEPRKSRAGGRQLGETGHRCASLGVDPRWSPRSTSPGVALSEDRASPLHQRRHMRGHRARQGVEVVAALQHRDDAAAAAPLGDLRQAPRCPDIVRLDQIEVGERIAVVGVEARRDDHEIEREAFDARQDQNFHRLAEGFAPVARAQGVNKLRT